MLSETCNFINIFIQRSLPNLDLYLAKWNTETKTFTVLEDGPEVPSGATTCLQVLLLREARPDLLQAHPLQVPEPPAEDLPLPVPVPMRMRRGVVCTSTRLFNLRIVALGDPGTEGIQILPGGPKDKDVTSSPPTSVLIPLDGGGSESG